VQAIASALVRAWERATAIGERASL
jgi:hypothetical protein